MGTKNLTEKQLYKAKIDWFKNNEYDEVKPLEFYREIFPIGSFQEEGDYDEKRGNGVLIYTDQKGKHKHRLVFDDLQELERWYGVEDVYVRGASFVGRNAKNTNASLIYALIFDLDGQGLNELHMVMQFMREGTNIPIATFTVLSGHGLHLYYVLDKPIRANITNIRKLNKLKEGLTKLIWNRYTSTIKEPQFQYCMQGFRMVGSASKLGKRYPVKAYRMSDKHYAIKELVDWIPKLKEWDEYRINLSECSTVPLTVAKELWPDWYKYRIEDGLEPKWHIKRDLYDWWFNQIKEGATYGHRYFCVMCLAIFAIKCDIEEDELRKDAYSLIPILDRLSKDGDESSRFTKEDVESALHGFRQEFKSWGRDKIALISAIPLQANKRNYRKQADHMKVISAIRDIVKPNWREGNGRPKGSKNSCYPKAEIIKQWRLHNPNGKKIDCHRDTGLSRMTINKWWEYNDKKSDKELLLEVLDLERSKHSNITEFGEFIRTFEQLLDEINDNRKLKTIKRNIELESLMDLYAYQSKLALLLDSHLSNKENYKIFWKSQLDHWLVY